MAVEERPVLFVEGDDDLHAIEHLLGKRGLRKESSWFPKLECAKDVDRLIRTVETAVMAGTGGAVGFVADADASTENRWRGVTRELMKTGMVLPAQVPAEGYIGRCDRSDTRVGVWVMPDNRSRGAIEEFLLTLIDPADPLLKHAGRATTEARGLGAAFPETALKKAELRAWLAWQEQPGFPYGRALNADYFDSARVAANPFVDWFTRLFRASAG